MNAEHTTLGLVSSRERTPPRLGRADLRAGRAAADEAASDGPSRRRVHLADTHRRLDGAAPGHAEQVRYNPPLADLKRPADTR